MSRPVYITFILLLSLGLRMTAVQVLRGWRDGPSRRHGADGVEYDALGLRLATSLHYSLDGSKSTSFRAPGFPLYLAVVYRAFGQDYRVAKLSFCVLGALGALLTFRLAEELVEEPRARWAGLLAACYPPNILFATRFDSENLFVPLLGLTLLATFGLARRPTARRGATAGLLLGWLALTRPNSALFLPVLVTLLGREQLRVGRLHPPSLIALTLVACATIGVWTGRNYYVHGRFVAIATNGGSTFYGGNNSVVARRSPLMGAWVSTTRLPGRREIDATPDEVSHDKMEWKLGLGWVRGHARLMPQLLLAKIARFLSPDIDSPNKAYVVFNAIAVVPFLLIAAVGQVICIRRRRFWTTPWFILQGVYFATFSTAIIFWGSPRFRDSIAPVSMCFAAAVLPSRGPGRANAEPDRAP